MEKDVRLPLVKPDHLETILRFTSEVQQTALENGQEPPCCQEVFKRILNPAQVLKNKR